MCISDRQIENAKTVYFPQTQFVGYNNVVYQRDLTTKEVRDQTIIIKAKLLVYSNIIQA